MKLQGGTPLGDETWLIAEPVRAQLASLEDTLNDITSCADEQLGYRAAHLVRAGGKRIRPALLFLAASLGQSEADDKAKRAAAGIELLHVAALYHDDVMDRAASRRGAQTANAMWGNRMAALAGTFLLARATATLASVGDEVADLASAATLAVCTGQLQEAENAYNLEHDIPTYLEIIGRKTASFFELPCRIGAAIGDLAPEDAEALGSYGRHVGVAFQLVDDALDLSGDPCQLGKPVRADLREGVYTLPVLPEFRSKWAFEG